MTAPRILTCRNRDTSLQNDVEEQDDYAKGSYYPGLPIEEQDNETDYDIESTARGIDSPANIQGRRQFQVSLQTNRQDGRLQKMM